MAVVRGNYVKRGRDERKGAKANIYYIQTRPGRDKERLTRTLFGASAIMGRYEAYQFINDAPKGTLFYRLKLSPDPAKEDTRRDLHMQKLTRDMMQRLEKRLNTPLPWAAALHDDHTNIRHVHILAAIPGRLHTHELEFLIREATQACIEQRRSLDLSDPRQVFGTQRLPWIERTMQPLSYQTASTGKRTSYRNSMPPLMSRGGRPHQGNTSCTCPRCHFPQTHAKQSGSHQCLSCGRMLHKKKELSLRSSKGRGLERSW